MYFYKVCSPHFDFVRIIVTSIILAKVKVNSSLLVIQNNFVTIHLNFT